MPKSGTDISFKVYLHAMIGFQYFNDWFYRNYNCSCNEMNNKSMKPFTASIIQTFGAFCNKLVSPTITTTSARCFLPHTQQLPCHLQRSRQCHHFHLKTQKLL